MTRLAGFCQDLEARLEPLVPPLHGLLAALRGLPSEDEERLDAEQEVDGLALRLEHLLDKAAAQQAFMIVFGPLKSGKSTLMNALAGAYVSEVSSLPAYPCMVFVGDGPERQLRVARYDGSIEEFTDLNGMRELLAEAHTELAGELRRAEQRGADLDPSVDLPHAIERIDIRMPATHLADAGAMLVDTPGLYSRMKFGYDVMAREFRDKAASAIFVVKTDNLFLEQIFDEFTDLLRLFSRIFLVVNLDASKQDLIPGGELAPSLEQLAPERVIEAFESLAMNAELRRAFDEGRLEIYPVDLLRAAGRRLRGRSESETTGADKDVEISDGFSRFEKDVRDYLSSSEFVQAFIRDTTRQATGLLDDLAESLRGGAIARLATRIETIKSEQALAQARADRARTLFDHDWEHAFVDVRDEVKRVVAEQLEGVGPTAIARAEDAVARWYDNDRSFAGLLRDDIGRILQDARRETIDTAAEVSRSVLGSDVSAAIVRAGVREAAEMLALPVAEIAREALLDVAEPAPGIELTPGISTRILPVRRSLFDWLFFRSAAAVRRRLLGSDDQPSRAIPSTVKHRRLDAARPVLFDALHQRVNRFVEESLSRATVEVLGRHIAQICRDLRAHLVLREEEEGRTAAVAAERLAVLAPISAEIEALAPRVDVVGSGILELSGRQKIGAAD